MVFAQECLSFPGCLQSQSHIRSICEGPHPHMHILGEPLKLPLAKLLKGRQGEASADLGNEPGLLWERMPGAQGMI